jgi:hypothetical protein
VASVSCGAGLHSASAIQECVKGRLPRGEIRQVTASTVEGVASIMFVHKSGEVEVISVFKTVNDAAQAAAAEARIGDAHDKQIRNVLYSGGRVFQAAIVDCVH